MSGFFLATKHLEDELFALQTADNAGPNEDQEEDGNGGYVTGDTSRATTLWRKRY